MVSIEQLVVTSQSLELIGLCNICMRTVAKLIIRVNSYGYCDLFSSHYAENNSHYAENNSHYAENNSHYAENNSHYAENNSQYAENNSHYAVFVCLWILNYGPSHNHFRISFLFVFIMIYKQIYA